jgi:hypothetical protein
MNQINAIFSLTDKSVVLQKVALQPGNNDLRFIFTSDQLLTDINGMKFTYVLKSNGLVIQDKKYPPENFNYGMVDNYPVEIERLNLIANKNYQLSVTYEFLGESWEKSSEFTCTDPQPFPSWTLVDQKWTPPVPKPDNGPYSWNEESQQWEPLEKLHRYS